MVAGWIRPDMAVPDESRNSPQAGLDGMQGGPFDCSWAETLVSCAKLAA